MLPFKMCISPDFFGATTKELTQSVDLSNLAITPCFTMLLSLSFTLVFNYLHVSQISLVMIDTKSDISILFHHWHHVSTIIGGLGHLCAHIVHFNPIKFVLHFQQRYGVVSGDIFCRMERQNLLVLSVQNWSS